MQAVGIASIDLAKCVSLAAQIGYLLGVAET
jgi:hypothetical protein